MKYMQLELGQIVVIKDSCPRTFWVYGWLIDLTRSSCIHAASPTLVGKVIGQGDRA